MNEDSSNETTLHDISIIGSDKKRSLEHVKGGWILLLLLANTALTVLIMWAIWPVYGAALDLSNFLHLVSLAVIPLVVFAVVNYLMLLLVSRKK